jgi:organic radical activating enzyme
VSDVYESCEWIESGLSFNRRSLHTCLIVHHHSGLPFLTDFNGGEVPLETVVALREQIRTAQRSGKGHPECRGCPHLRKQQWPRTQYPIEIVGIAHYAYCNIKCSYCFLQTQDPASFAAGLKPYSILPAIRALIRDKALAPHAIIDWGGGEPTSYPEFDELLELLLNHGTFHYIHSNGTRLPAPMRTTRTPHRVHVICSVDAGLPETYVLIKKKDYLERVWGVLSDYIRFGAAVSLKYIVKEENAGDADVEAFTLRAAKLRPREVILDIDYDFPVPSPAVTRALGRLQALSLARDVPVRFGFTGANFAPEHRVADRVEDAYQAELARRGWSDPRKRTLASRLARRAVRTLLTWSGWKPQPPVSASANGHGKGACSGTPADESQLAGRKFWRLPILKDTPPRS